MQPPEPLVTIQAATELPLFAQLILLVLTMPLSVSS
jgi:hypothetical protein